MRAKGQLDDALLCFRKAVEVNPTYAPAHTNLGAFLCDVKGDYDGAVACFRKAIELDPKWVMARTNLAIALEKKGLLDEAIACYQKAIELDPKDADARTWLAKTQRVAAAREMVAAFQRGSYVPSNNEERLAMIRWCRIQKLHRTASRLYAEAFAADPKLAEDLDAGRRYDAACFAALAAAGHGADPAELDEQERARLRKQAIGWLQAGLSALTKQIATVKPPDRAQVQKELRHWQNDADLAGVRDRELLAKLPEAEGKEWQALWAEVQALMDRAGKEAH